MKSLVNIKKDTGITYSVHLPLWSLELASPNSRIRAASCQCIIESIELAKILDPEAYVLHLTGPLAAEFSRLKFSSILKNNIINYINGFASDAIKQILRIITIPTEKIAVENIEFPFKFTRKLIDQYNLSICFDTGHHLVGYSGKPGKDSVWEFLDKNMDKIIEFHLNDGHIVDGKPIDHIAIGDGDFPIDAIDKIRENGFNGPLVFELTLERAEKSLKFIKENYSDLF